MKNSDINIRDPFVLNENGKYYMYGTRAKDFGCRTSGFDVYVSDSLSSWSDPIECFRSSDYRLNEGVNWAPEVHKYNGQYFMFATFTKENGLRGTFILSSSSPLGPFRPHSDGAVTPFEWECLDGTLYVEGGKPYIVFCHEHTQIIDGTICYSRLSDDLTHAIGEPVTLFKGSSPFYVEKLPEGDHYITDGPFMYRTRSGCLLMLWSTILHNQYAECIVRFGSGSIKGEFEHLPPLLDSDGGHGMLFNSDGKLVFTFHSPNRSGFEHPHFKEVIDNGDSIIFSQQ